MKEILLVVATRHESDMIRNQLFESSEFIPVMDTYKFGVKITLLHTGIGISNTSLHLGSYLALHRPDLMVNFGIGGSYRQDLQLGQVIEIGEEAFGDLGASSPKGFLDLQEMDFPLMEVNGKSFYNTLESPYNWDIPYSRYKGITVNEVSGVASQIAFRKFKWEGDVETMEGAAFFHSALWFDIPFLALRGISNFVEPRDRSKWKIKLAVKNVQTQVLELLENRALDFIGKFKENT